MGGQEASPRRPRFPSQTQESGTLSLASSIIWIAGLGGLTTGSIRLPLEFGGSRGVGDRAVSDPPQAVLSARFPLNTATAGSA